MFSFFIKLTNSLVTIGAPNASGDDSTPIAGIVLAVEALSEKTPQQEEKIRLFFFKIQLCFILGARKKNDDLPSNGGSIVVFCSLQRF